MAAAVSGPHQGPTGVGNGGPLRLAFELDGAGHHPAAWRHLGPAGFEPAALFTLGYARAVAQQAEAAGFDLLVLADSVAPADGPADVVQGRLDALTVAAALGPLTRTIGLAPVITTTHTEPFHVAKNLQSLDWVSRGRGAWKPEVSASGAEARAFGRRDPAEPGELWAEAADVVEVARRLWDSWDDDAIIRHAPTGRFVDRTRLHSIDFTGDRFSVRGPSITPRSPQAQLPILVELGADSPPEAWHLAGAEADLVVLRGTDQAQVADLRATLDRHLASASAPALRTGPEPVVLAALTVLLDTPGATAAERRRSLDADSPAATPAAGAASSGAASAGAGYEGSGAGLLEAFSQWRSALALDGFLLRPAVAPVDLGAFAATVTPHLPPAPAEPLTLRERFGWPRPANRYATLS